MINFLRKLVSGYSLEKRSLNGQEYRYRFQGKPIFFDPNQMLREFKHRRDGQEVVRKKLDIEIAQIIHLLPKYSEDLLPSVICEGSRDGKDFTVSRYTFKHGLNPVSLYRFSLDGKPIGDFYRKYDYGAETQNFILKIASLHGDFIPLNQDSVLWENDLGEMAFVEKFGHTQIWLWKKDPDSKLLS
jgi:hypothetical protein